MKSKLKKVFMTLSIVLMVGIIFISIGGCGKNIDTSGNYIDLTNINSTMVYSQVYNMLSSPSEYKGKTIKASGTHSVYYDNATNTTYHAIIIKDALGCCSQGLEFVLSNGNYPKQNKYITVEGIFGTYKENGTTYCYLKSSKIV